MSVWDDVVGQEVAVEPLVAAAADPAAMTHAWLITGPPGSGRSNAARAFAAALLCPQRGCGECNTCRTVLAGSHADVTILATERVSITIEEVRQLVSLAQRAPTVGSWRVIIIEDVDRMTERTANVLLKAIEEPPANTVWVLAAPSPQDVIVTIRSRCRVIGLRIPSVESVVELLANRDGIDPAVADAAARAAQCHIGRARHLATTPDAMTQRDELLRAVTSVRGVGDAVLAAAELIELAGDQATEQTEQRNAAERAELLRALGIEGETVPPALRAQVRALEEDQKRRATRIQRDGLDRVMLDLISWYRDVLVVQLGAQVDLVNVAHADAIRATAAETSPATTLDRIDAIATARTRLAANVAPVLTVEAMAVALRPQA